MVIYLFLVNVTEGALARKKRVNRKVILGIILTALILGMFGVGFNTSVIEVDGTIYIRPDGSIDPNTAPIQREGDLYTFTDNIYDEIVVERDNIIIDGNSYTVQGTGTGMGLDITDRNNITVKNCKVENFFCGIDVWESIDNTFIGNRLINNKHGINLMADCNWNIVFGNYIINSTYDGIYSDGHNCTITGNYVINSGTDGIFLAGRNNLVTNNMFINNIESGIEIGLGRSNTIVSNSIVNSEIFGIELSFSEDNIIRSNTIANINRTGIYVGKMSYDNRIYYNNFIENAIQVGREELEENIWDDGGLYGRPKGNYWSNYTGKDLDWDGIGDTDTPHLGIDMYPLIAPWVPREGDINLDGIVDIFDVVLVANNFGKTFCPS